MIENPRLKDWERRLVGVTEREKRAAPAWGVNDCLLAAASAAEAVCGVDICADIRGTYDSEIGAAKILLKRGYRDVEEGLADYFPPVGRLLARRGDLAVAEVSGQITAGWITEYGFAHKSPAGLSFMPQTLIKRAFKVG